MYPMEAKAGRWLYSALDILWMVGIFCVEDIQYAVDIPSNVAIIWAWYIHWAVDILWDTDVVWAVGILWEVVIFWANVVQWPAIYSWLWLYSGW